MVDDPTTTGPKWPLPGEPPEDWQEVVAEAVKKVAAAGGDTSQAEVATGKGLHFELPNFTGEFQIIVTERMMMFGITVAPPGGMEKASESNPPTQHAFHFPRALLGDVDPEELFGIIAHNFKSHIWQRFAVEAVLFFTTLSNFTLLNMNPGLSGAGSRDRIIKNHAAHSEAALRQFFNNVQPPRRGRASPWTVLELSTAVRKAVEQMAAEHIPPPFTAAKVAVRMQKLYPEKAPPSGKGLLKLVKRHGLKWADLVPGDSEQE